MQLESNEKRQRPGNFSCPFFQGVCAVIRFLGENRKKSKLGLLFLVLWVHLQGHTLFAYEITERFSIGGVLAGIYQYQCITNAPGYESEGRGLLAFQPQISFTPTDNDELFAKFGFAAGNGLMGDGISPFVLAPWGGDVQDAVKDINGRNRDYLLTAWYKHTFQFSKDHTLGLTGGIIDATDYLDTNAHANDEYNQYLNAAFVNGPNAFVPSYDIGGELEWQFGAFSVNGAVMAVGSNGETGTFDEPYSFFGIQLGYSVDFGLGEGNYRLLADTTSSDFSDVSQSRKERLSSLSISFDQQLGKIFGAWLRFAWDQDAAAIDYKDFYSGGLNIAGNLWGRENDNIGIGYGHLTGGNLDVDQTDVFEIYGRFALNNICAVTGDIQYMKDSMKKGDSPSGWIFGLRATAEF